MQVKRNGFVTRTAYAFEKPSDWPTGNVNGCVLFWRVIWYGCGKVILNLAYIFAGLVFFGIIGLPIWFLLVGVFGAGLKHTPLLRKADGSTELWNWVWEVGNDLIVLNYKPYRLPYWPEIRGIRIVPGPVLLAGLFLYIEYVIFGNAIETWRAGAMDGFGSVVAILEICVAIIFLALVLNDALEESEFGQLVRLRARAIWEKACPLVEIVG